MIVGPVAALEHIIIGPTRPRRLAPAKGASRPRGNVKPVTAMAVGATSRFSQPGMTRRKTYRWRPLGRQY